MKFWFGEFESVGIEADNLELAIKKFRVGVAVDEAKAFRMEGSSQESSPFA